MFPMLMRVERCFTKQYSMSLVIISTAVLHNALENPTSNKIFIFLHSNMFDTVIKGNHVYTFMKLISQSYCTILLHHMNMLLNEKANGDRIWKQLSRLIVFKLQQQFFCNKLNSILFCKYSFIHSFIHFEATCMGDVSLMSEMRLIRKSLT